MQRRRITRGSSGQTSSRPLLAKVTSAAATALFAAFGLSCGSSGQDTSPCPPNSPNGQCTTQLTLLHTSDIHSRVIPYDLEITQIDAQLGLGPENGVVNVGGAARLSYVVGRERARSNRVLHLDSGDCFEGAPIFNYFLGEPEVRAQSLMGIDAMVIGNHEFDLGPLDAYTQMRRWADFPLLAANYMYAPPVPATAQPMSTILKPYALFNEGGLRIAVIGMANLSSLGSIFQQPNSLGITPLNTNQAAQFYVDLLRPMVDVVVVLSHLGLQADQQMVQNTTGIDVVLGGHNHIVIDPPETLNDCSSDINLGKIGYIWVADPALDVTPGASPPHDPKHPDPVNHPYEMQRQCTPRRVFIKHSGAFAKYLGRLDMQLSNDPTQAATILTTGNPKDYDPANGFEVISIDTTNPAVFPISAQLVPWQDPTMDNMLEPYKEHLNAVADLDLLVGYAPSIIKRNAIQGGDSPLGNVVATSMWHRLGVQTDFAMTNSTGIRVDMNAGPVTQDEMFNIFPFSNTISKMVMSGLEVQTMFDYIAQRSALRGCSSQSQIAGARVTLNCNGCSRSGAKALCEVDGDCIGGQPGSCVLDVDGGTVKHCNVTACAERVFVGTATPLVQCMNDAGEPDDTMCPGKLAGACFGQGTSAVCEAPLDPLTVYEMATNSYLASGGSGYWMLKDNTSKFDTQIQQRDALTDYIREGKPCGYSAATAATRGTPDGLPSCSNDSDCNPASAGGGNTYVCACPGATTETLSGGAYSCQTDPKGCDSTVGRCVLRACRDQVAQFHDRLCGTRQDPAPTASTIQACSQNLGSCQMAGEECKLLTCVDQNLGAITDGRVQVVGR